MTKKTNAKQNSTFKKGLGSNANAPIEIDDDSDGATPVRRAPLRVIDLDPSSEDEAVAPQAPVHQPPANASNAKRSRSDTLSDDLPEKASKLPRLTTPLEDTRPLDVRSPSRCTTDASRSSSRPNSPTPPPDPRFPQSSASRGLRAYGKKGHSTAARDVGGVGPLSTFPPLRHGTPITGENRVDENRRSSSPDNPASHSPLASKRAPARGTDTSWPNAHWTKSRLGGKPAIKTGLDTSPPKLTTPLSPLKPADARRHTPARRNNPPIVRARDGKSSSGHPVAGKTPQHKGTLPTTPQGPRHRGTQYGGGYIRGDKENDPSLLQNKNFKRPRSATPTTVQAHSVKRSRVDNLRTPTQKSNILGAARPSPSTGPKNAIISPNHFGPLSDDEDDDEEPPPPEPDWKQASKPPAKKLKKHPRRIISSSSPPPSSPPKPSKPSKPSKPPKPSKSSDASKPPDYQASRPLQSHTAQSSIAPPEGSRSQSPPPTAGASDQLTPNHATRHRNAQRARRARTPLSASKIREAVEKGTLSGEELEKAKERAERAKAQRKRRRRRASRDNDEWTTSSASASASSSPERQSTRDGAKTATNGNGKSLPRIPPPPRRLPALQPVPRPSKPGPLPQSPSSDDDDDDDSHRRPSPPPGPPSPAGGPSADPYKCCPSPDELRRVVTKGIQNLGSTCYAGSSLQVLRTAWGELSRYHDCTKFEEDSDHKPIRVGCALNRVFRAMTDLNQSGPVDPSPLVQEMRRLPDKDQWDWNQQHDIREFVHFLLSAIAPQLTRPDAPVVLSSAPCTDCVRELNIPRPLCERFMPTIQGAPSSGSIQQLVDDWQREGSWETTPAVTSDATCSHGQPNLNFGTLNNVPLGVSRFGQFLPIAISRNLGNVRDYGQVILNPTIRLRVPERGEQVWALRAVSVSHANPFDLTSTLAGHWTSAVKYQNGWYHYDDRSREMIPNLNDATVLLHSVVSQNVGLVLYELVNTPNCALHSATSSHHAHIPAPSSLPTPAVSSSSSRPYRPSAQTLPSSTVVQPVSQSPHNEHAHDDDTVSFEDSERYLSDAIKSQGGGDDDSQLQDSLRDEDDIFGDGKENRLAAALKTWKIRCSTEIEFARMRDQLLNEAKTASERLAVLNRIRTSGMRDKIDPAIPVLIDQLPGGPELLADLETDPFGLKPERHSRILEPVNETTASPLAQDFYLRGAEMTRAQFEKILDDHVKQHPVNADLVSGTRELLTDKEMGDKIIILYVGMSRRGTYQRHKEDRDQAGRPTGRRYFTYLLPDIEAIAHFRLYRIRGLDRNFPQGPTFTGNIEEYLIDAVGPASLNVAHGGRSSGKFSPDHMPPKVKEVTDQVQTTYRVSTPKRNSDDVQPRVQKFNTLVDTLAEHYKNQPGSKPIKEETLEKIKSLGSLIGTFSDEWGSGVCLGKDLTEAELDNKSHIFDENAGDGPHMFFSLLLKSKGNDRKNLSRKEIGDIIGAFLDFMVFGSHFKDMSSLLLWLAAALTIFGPKFIYTWGNLVTAILRQGLVNLPDKPVIRNFLNNPTYPNFKHADNWFKASQWFRCFVASKSLEELKAEPLVPGEMFVARLPLGRVVIVFAFPHNGCWKYIGRLVVMGEYLTFLCLLKLLILEHACTDETLEKRPDPDMSDYDYLGWIAGTVEQRSIESDLQPMIDSVAWEVRKLRRAIQILSRNVTPRDSEVPKIEEHFYPRSLRGNGGVMDDKEFEEIDESMIADAPFYRLPPLIVAVLRDAPGGKAMTRGEILETISRFCPHYRMGPWSGWMLGVDCHLRLNSCFKFRLRHLDGDQSDIFWTYKHNPNGDRVTRPPKDLKTLRDLRKDARPHKCPHEGCQSVFHQKLVRDRHYKRVHLGVQEFPCDKCDQSFKSAQARDHHEERVHLGLRPHKCLECGQVVATRQYLKRHVDAEHRGLRPFKCLVDGCDTAFPRSYELKAHVKRVHDRWRPHQCLWPGCPWWFAAPYNLKQHVDEVHHGKRPYLCHHLGCGKRFARKHHLKTHRLTHDLQREVYMCTVEGCDRQFVTKDGLKAHIESHNREKPHVCTQSGCDERFATEKQLIAHMKRDHHIDKPFTCSHPDCPKSFTRKDHLERHKREHDESKWFKCEKCEFVTPHPHSIKTHLKDHDRKTPFVCSWSGCTESFANNKSLATHMKTHSDHPYICPHCDKAWATITELKRHIKIHE